MNTVGIFIQMNAELLQENARLKTEVETLKKAFHAFHFGPQSFPLHAVMLGYEAHVIRHTDLVVSAESFLGPEYLQPMDSNSQVVMVSGHLEMCCFKSFLGILSAVQLALGHSTGAKSHFNM